MLVQIIGVILKDHKMVVHGILTLVVVVLHLVQITVINQMQDVLEPLELLN